MIRHRACGMRLAFNVTAVTPHDRANVLAAARESRMETACGCERQFCRRARGCWRRCLRPVDCSQLPVQLQLAQMIGYGKVQRRAKWIVSFNRWTATFRSLSHWPKGRVRRSAIDSMGSYRQRKTWLSIERIRHRPSNLENFRHRVAWPHRACRRSDRLDEGTQRINSDRGVERTRPKRFAEFECGRVEQFRGDVSARADGSNQLAANTPEQHEIAFACAGGSSHSRQPHQREPGGFHSQARRRGGSSAGRHGAAAAPNSQIGHRGVSIRRWT